MIEYGDIINYKKKQSCELLEDLKKLKNYDATINKNSYIGHRILYHYQIDNICRTETGKHPSLYQSMTDATLKNKLMNEVIKRKGSITPANIFETNRINRGSVVLFKPTTAMYLYKKYNATSVLDPTAGWGGRMLGAWALGIDYTGFDTNINLQPAYTGFLQLLETEKPSLQINFKNCLTADFSKLKYDFVLTSPPYNNLERYENMQLFSNDDDYYNNFLILLINKCLKYIQPGGHVAINVSSKIYNKLTEKYNYPLANEEIPYNQSTKKQDMIYVWNCL